MNSEKLDISLALNITSPHQALDYFLSHRVQTDDFSTIELLRQSAELLAAHGGYLKEALTAAAIAYDGACRQHPDYENYDAPNGHSDAYSWSPKRFGETGRKALRKLLLSLLDEVNDRCAHDPADAIKTLHTAHDMLICAPDELCRKFDDAYAAALDLLACQNGLIDATRESLFVVRSVGGRRAAIGARWLSRHMMSVYPDHPQWALEGAFVAADAARAKDDQRRALSQFFRILEMALQRLGTAEKVRSLSKFLNCSQADFAVPKRTPLYEVLKTMKGHLRQTRQKAARDNP